MNIATPLVKGAGQIAALSGDSATSVLKSIEDWAGLMDDGSDGGLGMLMSALAGAAAALAVAIVLTIYFHHRQRTTRELIRHGIAVALALGLIAFVASDMRHSALAYFGLTPFKPAVQSEIRRPREALLEISYALRGQTRDAFTVRDRML
jgi:hypothetical protein